MLPVDGACGTRCVGWVVTDVSRRRLVQLDVAHPAEGELLERRPGPHEVTDEVIGGIGEDRFRGVVLDDFGPGLQDRDPVAELDRLIEVVGDEDDGLAELVLQAQQFVLQPLAGNRVDGPERLVHQQNRRVGSQCPCDPHPLLLPTGQLTGIAVTVLRRVEAHQIEQFIHPLGNPLLVPLEQARHDRDVVADSEVRKKPGSLPG